MARRERRRRPAGAGFVYRPTYKAADGTRRQSRYFWLAFSVDGKRVREPTKETKEIEADRLLRERLARRDAGKPVSEVGQPTVGTMCSLLLDDYTANNLRSRDRAELSTKHLIRILGKDTLARLVDEEAVTRYVATRRGEVTLRGGHPVAAASINRELAALKRAFRLSRRKLDRVPDITLLREDNVRKGFFERGNLEAVLAQLREPERSVVLVAYLTGWRVPSEILTRQWRHVDLAAGWLRLEPGETKNGEGRMFPLTPELRTVLEARRKATTALERQQHRVIPWVFHRRGEPITTFRGRWATACRNAGVPGRLLHDFRRSAVRNLERAAVPRSASMAMIGHLTESVYRRYSIVDETMLKEAAVKMEALHRTAEEGARADTTVSTLSPRTAQRSSKHGKPGR